MKSKKLVIVAGAISLFACLVAGVFILVRFRVINTEVGLLLLISLLGMYIGFGVLIAAYRLIIKLD
jgi:hypothetical protein